MSKPFPLGLFDWLLQRLALLLRPVWRWAVRLIMGRRFMHSIERNQEAADHLDAALKEMLER